MEHKQVNFGVERAESIVMKIHQNFRKRKVLVVDDSIMQVLMTQRILQGWNLQVDIAYNANDAEAKAKICDYDLVLIDSRLPGVGGAEAVDRMRTTSGKNPVFFVTALSSENVSVSGDVAEVISKPFSIPVLNSMIYKHLKQRGL